MWRNTHAQHTHTHYTSAWIRSSNPFGHPLSRPFGTRPKPPSLLAAARTQARIRAANLQASQTLDNTTSIIANMAAATSSPAAFAATLKPIEYPYRRRWIDVNQQQTKTDASSSSSPSSSSPFSGGVPFTLVSYNMLAQCLVRRDLFQYCSKSALKVNLRKENLLTEISSLNTDILCAQEVDRSLFDSWWLPKLGQLGYRAEWASRNHNGKHGCAIFYKHTKFEVFTADVIQFADVLAAPYAECEDNLHDDPAKRKSSVFEEMNRPNIAQIVGFRHKEKNPTPATQPIGFYVTNTHLFWDPRYRFVRLRQCQTLLDQLAHVQAQQKTAYPCLLAGDWNVTPDNIIHHYLTARTELERNEERWTQFLTPVEHGFVRGEEGSAPVESSPTPPDELAANSGVSNSSLAKMMAAVRVADGAAPAGDAASSPAAAAAAVDTWVPLSNAPIHQIRTHMVRQADGTIKEQSLEGAVDTKAPSSMVRLEEVKAVLHHSRALPILHSVYAGYDRVAPADTRDSLKKSQSSAYCRWTGEPPFTNYTDKFKGTLDYIFMPTFNPAADMIDDHTPESHPWKDVFQNQSCQIRTTHLLEIPKEEVVNRMTALPTDAISSDHIPIGAKFVLARRPAPTPDAETKTTKTTTTKTKTTLTPTLSTNTGASTLAKLVAASLSPVTTIGSLMFGGASAAAPAKDAAAAAPASTATTAPSFAPFSPSLFTSLLRTQACGRPLHYSRITTSTMDLCKDQLFGAAASAPTPTSGTVWLAEEQTKGRGRVQGRTWNSPPCANLYFTLLIQLHDLPWDSLRAELTKLNQSVCLSVVQSIESALVRSLGVRSPSDLPEELRPKIKWPNDVWIGSRKCSGMLIDSEITGNKMSVVIGVGLNVLEDMRAHADADIRASATSVAQSLTEYRAAAGGGSASSSSNTPIQRESILADFLSNFESCAARTPDQVLASYRAYDMLVGSSIIVMPKKREDVASYYTARAIDYSKDGYLIVEREDGQREELLAEEVSIRPNKQQT